MAKGWSLSIRSLKQGGRVLLSMLCTWTGTMLETSRLKRLLMALATTNVNRKALLG